MKRFAIALATVLCAAAAVAPPSQAAFGLDGFDLTFTDENGAPANQAGSHPYAMTTSFRINHSGEGGAALVEGKVRDVLIEQVAGFVGDATAVPLCSTEEFVLDECPDKTAVGIQTASVAQPSFYETPSPVFSLPPPPGAPVRLGWKVKEVPLVADVGVKQSPDYNILASVRGINQTVEVFGSVLQLWGVPADPRHDSLRGYKCAGQGEVVEEKEIVLEEGPSSSCASGDAPVAFLTTPRSCEGPLATSYRTRSWEEPGTWVSDSVLTHDDAVPPNPRGFVGCGKLGFAPAVESKATADSAETGTGLDFSIRFNDEGLGNPAGLAQSDIEKTVVTLPEGVTVNPSIGEGLGVCEPGDLDDETIAADPGEGCPNSSKIGTVSVRTPLLDDPVGGSVFLAEQDDPRTDREGAENPFDSLLAFYIVLKDRGNGVLVKLPALVEPDPETGQLVTTVEDIPQFPFSEFEFHFREGQRAPLVTPPACGTYETEVELTPWADPSRELSTSAEFQITRGVGGGPCPPGGVAPFAPGFEAGSLNNAGGAYSPFLMRLTRQDGEQDMTKFSSILPPGVVGKLAGIPYCPEAAVALAKSKTGREELAAPSCPAASAIGRTLAGAGVGSALTYVPGALYLAGPYNGAPLSVLSVTPAVAGPFDAGTVVVRIALRIDPLTAEVIADGAASDPIPHILEGIVLKVRDLRVYVDRPGFILNPTSCDPSSAKATLFGSFRDVFNPADDLPVALRARYQAADCAALGFKPRLALSLKGGTRRGAHPALRGVFRPRPGNANLKRMVLRLPTSAFLDQGHIRTICTRVQFAAGACPKAAIYGRARAWTPLLDTPLEGPVYLRSSDNNLPDFVAALKGIVDVEAVARIDSVRGGIRATFTQVPDAPLTRVVVRMQGGKKGLIVNSRNLCHRAKRNRANAGMVGHNGKRVTARPPVRALGCKKQRKARRSSHRR